ncbi:hypothetical protein GIB67_000097 [Kingdonia uniflora]|uniref:Uncharacterized protein n=1 Tax=Kingdonia uniflora TaxID=39325 RepID=A0A7J7M5T0_9MAGN|nr:hypothetical protein GIB67_000097 [Kingdonia uniflora]
MLFCLFKPLLSIILSQRNSTLTIIGYNLHSLHHYSKVMTLKGTLMAMSSLYTLHNRLYYQSGVIGLSTSHAAWDALQKHYASKSRAQTMQLRHELQAMHKGSKPMKDYFLHAKELADNLVASGYPMSDPDLQHIILIGLDNAYDTIVTTLTAMMVNISMDDFNVHLIAFDMRLEAQIVMLQQHPVANAGTQQHNMYLKPGFNQNMNRSYNDNQYRNRGQGMNQFTNRSQPVQSVVRPCLFCCRKNHTAQTCWHRFDQMSQATPSPPKAYVAVPGSFADYN